MHIPVIKQSGDDCLSTFGLSPQWYSAFFHNLFAPSFTEDIHW